MTTIVWNTSKQSLQGHKHLHAWTSLGITRIKVLFMGGLHRYEPDLQRRVAAPRGKLSLTRQGISLIVVTHRQNFHLWDQTFLLISAYRYADRTISSLAISIASAWRVVSEDSNRSWSFLLIICTQRIVTAINMASSVGYSGFPAFGQVLLRQRCSP